MDEQELARTLGELERKLGELEGAMKAISSHDALLGAETPPAQAGPADTDLPQGQAHASPPHTDFGRIVDESVERPAPRAPAADRPAPPPRAMEPSPSGARLGVRRTAAPPSARTPRPGPAWHGGPGAYTGAVAAAGPPAEDRPSCCASASGSSRRAAS